MARNYVQFYSSRVQSGGNFQGFIRHERQDVVDDAQFYIDNFGYTANWLGVKGYFLINADNITALLQNWAIHYQQALNSQWVFFQDGLKALESPRETWSHGE